ncbi:type III-B CRISPR module RAMP protein Cmr6 [Ancylobacter sp. WKF20]|uniref:type III-B CRISPR module RAMP protein Cmr6 n=1 Tax=Ancylobacter sp. WKF20 TaxID=3039801 RepID=UPI0024345092|nr:type III-B CRISPR module RAMP protein Cmr6 [Ancylobacter sp. WKF20]WGD28402.1 type III-B CRISPR module RAMP protein Cmr6 [Ancylobacter sp. WKF20]
MTADDAKRALVEVLSTDPVLSKVQGAAPASGGHAGLWWERYGGAFVTERRSKGVKTRNLSVPRSNWIKALADRVGNADAMMKARLTRHHQQRAALIGPKGVQFTATLRTPLVIGMGLPHPTENGLMFHPTLGVPYIPGSSLKGAVQAFVYEWLLRGAYDVAKALDEDIKRIFGQPHRLEAHEKAHEEKATKRGSVVFLDALPVSWPSIGTEILNPHIGNYLTSANEPLTDGIHVTLKPIAFASVAPGCTFAFLLRPSPMAPVSAAEAEADVALAAGWLAATLTDLGIGAKTKSGFGRFADIREIAHASNAGTTSKDTTS